MNKKFVAFSILLTIGMLLMVPALTPRPVLMSSAPQVNDVREISFSLQATDEPPIPLPTIVIPVPTIVVNPPPGSSTGFLGLTPLTILIFVLVGAVILIALVAVLRR